MAGNGEKVGRNTVKAFLRKNAGKVLILCKSRFDAMEDGVRSTGDREFHLALAADRFHENNMGVQGAWFVGGGRDWIFRFEDAERVGFEVSNSCGSFSLAVAK